MEAFVGKGKKKQNSIATTAIPSKRCDMESNESHEFYIILHINNSFFIVMKLIEFRNFKFQEIPNPIFPYQK